MGQPKLLLPVHGQPLIAHVIAAWRQAGITPLVVIRPGDDELARACRALQAEVLQPALAPAEMKVSVQLALRHLAGRYAPGNTDAWLLAPADMPGLSPAIITRLVSLHRARVAALESPAVLVPTLSGKRGHPVLFPFSFAALVHQLGEKEGVKAILDRNPPSEIRCDDCVAGPRAFLDVDTPADYDSIR